jgi:stearoyl-CoA desaturase (Delta-9 desaturase)
MNTKAFEFKASFSNGIKSYRYQFMDLISVGGSLLAFLSLYNQGITLIDFCIFSFMFVLTVIGGEIGFHRLFSHKSFKVIKPIRLFLAFIGSMTGEAPIIEYAAYHRCHHAFCDSDGDPHSPHQLKILNPLDVLNSLWYTYRGWKYTSNGIDWRSKYTRDLDLEPDIVAINNGFYWIVLFSLFFPCALGLLLTQSISGAWTAFLWGGLFRLFLVSFIGDCVLRAGCHLIGTCCFISSSTCHSRNITLLAIPTFGVSLHNNHHAFPDSAILNFKWWHIDLAGLIILFLQRVGLAWDVKIPSKAQIQSRLIIKN